MDQQRLALIRCGEADGIRRIGTGYLIAPRLVLTARHVVVDKSAAAVWQRIDVRVGHPQDPVVSRCTATVEWTHPEDHDVALLLLAKPIKVPGAVKWGHPVGKAPLPYDALGYPRATVKSGQRKVEHLRGELAPLSGGHGVQDLYTLDQGPAPAMRADGKQAWSGASGSAVFCRDHLVGVVIHDDDAFENRRLHACPARIFANDTRFAELLQEHGDSPPRLAEISAGPPSAAGAEPIWPITERVAHSDSGEGLDTPAFPSIHTGPPPVVLRRQLSPKVEQTLATLAVYVRRSEEKARWRLLGEDIETIDVAFDFRPAPGHQGTGVSAGPGRLQEVVDYYQRLRPRRLVITGEPGAGKTTMAVQLMVKLLTSRQTNDPVPVRLSLSSWNPDQELENWLARHLAATYPGLSRRKAGELVEARGVLPVLDGLDEMDAESDPGPGSRAARALQKLNAYVHGENRGELVLTCRSRTYRSLQEHAQTQAYDAAHIELRDINAITAYAYLERRAGPLDADKARWRPVLDRLREEPEGPMAKALSTPWRLTLAATVYRSPRRDPEKLLNLPTASAVADHLLRQFVPTAVTNHPPPRAAWDAHQVSTWLSTLATYLHTNTVIRRGLDGFGLKALPGTDIVVHELWPMAGVRRVRAWSAFITSLPSLACAVAVFLGGVLALRDGSWGDALAMLGVSLMLGWWVLPYFWITDWPKLGYRVTLNPPSRRWKALWYAALFVLTVLFFERPIGAVFCFLFWLAIRAPATAGVVNPRHLLRNYVTAQCVTGLVAVCAMHALLWDGSVVTSVVALFFAAALLMSHSLDLGVRYVVLLLCTRRQSGKWLPWRLGLFLDWCSQAGLVRVAGTAYQFRHRELQEHLAGTDEIARFAKDVTNPMRRRIVAASAVAKAGDERGAALLTMFARTTWRMPGDRIRAAMALLESDDSGGADLLAELAQDATLGDGYRVQAAGCLKETDAKRGIDTLVQLIKDTTLDDAWRLDAARALKHPCDGPGVDALAHIAQDTGLDLIARAAAASALTDSGDSRGADMLIRHFKDPSIDMDERAVAMWAIQKVSDDPGVHVLTRLARDTDRDGISRVIAACVLLLASTDGDQGSDVLAELGPGLAQDTTLDVWIRMFVAAHLTVAGDSRGRGVLAELSRDVTFHDDVREEAAELLAEIEKHGDEDVSGSAGHTA
ncbi:NACHT domain-containing protein [Streptomyces cellulosae]